MYRSLFAAPFFNGTHFKTLLLSCAITLSALSLKAQGKETITQIDFTKSTRGYQESIRVTPDSVISRIENFRADEKVKQTGRKLSKGEWSALVKTLKKVPLKSIPDLASPGTKSASDAALQGTLQITTSQRQTYAHSFDNEDPNAKLAPLLKKMKALTTAAKK